MKDGKQKINWDAMAVIIVVVGGIVSGIIGYADLQGQTQANTHTIASVVRNTTEKVDGTLKNDVEKNKENIADNKSDIKVLTAKLDAIQEAQVEIRKEMRTSNAELKAMMNTILQKLN